MKITFHVQPCAKKSGYVGLHGANLKIKLAALPKDGEANAELINFLSKKLGIAKSQIKIIAGQTSKIKIVEIPSIIDNSEVIKLLVED